MDADKRSEQAEVVTVVKEQPTVEGTNDHLYLDGDSQVTGQTVEVESQSGIPEITVRDAHNIVESENKEST